MNRRRHANLVPLATLATWLLIAAAITIGGVYYVNCKNELIDRGGNVRYVLRDYSPANETLYLQELRALLNE